MNYMLIRLYDCEAILQLFACLDVLFCAWFTWCVWETKMNLYRGTELYQMDSALWFAGTYMMWSSESIQCLLEPIYAVSDLFTKLSGFYVFNYEVFSWIMEV